MRKILTVLLLTLIIVVSIPAGNVFADETGWMQDDYGYWYLCEDGSYPAGEWMYLNDSWYFFDEDGYMYTGWIFWDDEWLYLDESGRLLISEEEYEEDFEYEEDIEYREDAEPAYTRETWISDDRGFRYIDYDGYFIEDGWAFIDGDWYYFDQDGYMYIGWLYEYGDWYYMDHDGVMLTGLQYIDGRSYRFNDYGAWVPHSASGSTMNYDQSSDLITPELYEFLLNVYDSCITEDMTDEEKLYAAFLYVSDRSHFYYNVKRMPYYLGMDWPLVYTLDMMQDGGSDCHGFTALFGYLARMIGYDNILWNQVGSHAWLEIDGLIYDPVYMESTYYLEIFGCTYEEAYEYAQWTEAGYQYFGEDSGTYNCISVPYLGV